MYKIRSDSENRREAGLGWAHAHQGLNIPSLIGRLKLPTDD